MNSSILDLGTGSGLIALSIAKFYKNNKILGLDKNFKSIMIAKKNAIIHDLSNVYFILSDWFNSIKNMHFDIIVSNPPYISYEENFLLKKNIFFEPLNALFSEKKGLRDIKYIIQESKKYLNSNGWLMIEHGFMQRKIILKYFKIHKYSNIISYKDIYGIYRITIGQIK
ncbi:HemK/PrmC family methyltransferase [Buchnera aphidicola (Mollitrichosiphum nigrofasciatum)]|uniref:HemK/PrmC family methyltransferase n=1 Tax=Buchnera aphidicola TaxID=9 RepID=UPI0031B840B4